MRSFAYRIYEKLIPTQQVAGSRECAVNPCWNRVAVGFVVLATITWLGLRDEISALIRSAGTNPAAAEAGICPRHDATRCTVEPHHRSSLAADLSVEPKDSYLAADLSVELKYGYPADDLSVQLEESYF